jgi:acetyl esterase
MATASQLPVPAMAAPARAILERIRQSGEPPMETLTAQQARAVADVRVLRTSFARREGVLLHDEFASGGPVPVPVRIYRPAALASRQALPTLIYYHGGGMVVGSIETVDPHCRWLCVELGCVVVSVGYRLGPEHRFPAAVDDAVAATVWVQDHATDFGADASRLALMGESAGATLVAVSSMALRDRGRPGPSIQILVYGGMDASVEGPSWDRLGEGNFLTRAKSQWFLDQYLRSPADALDPRASPVRAERFDGLPPALVITAGLDPMIDGSELYVERMRAAGVPVEYRCFENWPHGFFYWADTEAAQETMRLCIAAAARSWGQP